ncbi:beta-glucosidase BglX [Tuanshanicoccus lijuaniae]|uniref:beta-glucosidase BglX n=1 Tax=Aerococcaceae bacterium zg-1292 TaxID=2774330 RepID=UPI001BD85541|nr:beta-glucosidase BglX [Aerococcaceae bacterium zg-BR9]MBS4455721.1 beta-glucosidase BglX [Aerococcaceae bacterium zg-A91]MBS4457472.1 beta-glucosidase BglX [Aerococcaceae bacterium zg-BR33]
MTNKEYIAYKNSNLTVEERTNDLLNRMSIKDKLAQLTQVWGLEQMVNIGMPHPEDMAAHGVGSMLYVSNPEDKNKYQRIAMENTSLGIPLLYGTDVVHGYRTAFPLPLAMACSWDPDLLEKVQRVAAKEARADGIHWTFYPNADIARDARWGRVGETMGEDPYLSSKMVAAEVKGFQGDDLSSEEAIAACLKHFVGYGACVGGRDYEQVNLSESELRNIYYVPFAAGIDQGVETVMTAYMDLNNEPLTASQHQLKNVLRDELGFDRLLVTDAGTIGNLITQGNAKDGLDATEKAIKATVNMDMGSYQYLQNLPKLLEQGKIGMEQLDEAVRPILRTKFKLGLFENPYCELGKSEALAKDPVSHSLARKAAQDSIVLLKNEKEILPLKDSTLGKVAVIGRYANSQIDCGAATVVGVPAFVVTPLEGLKERLGEKRVLYAPGPTSERTIPNFISQFIADFGLETPESQTWEEQTAAIEEAIRISEQSDIIIAFLGENADMSGEATSRSELSLPGRQQELLEKLKETGKPVILVLIGGRPLAVTWAQDHVDAILMAWQPGREGGRAIADILFGDVNPSAHLAMTFPRSVGQCPLYYATTQTHQPVESQPQPFSRYWNELSSPLYPFGYGLSYSNFVYSNLRLSKKTIAIGENLTVSVDVTNTSARGGREVVQLYLHQRWGSDTRPSRELKGFKKVMIPSGKTDTVTFSIGSQELKYYSTAKQCYVQDAAAFELWVGSDSTADLKAEFEVTEQ